MVAMSGHGAPSRSHVGAIYALNRGAGRQAAPDHNALSVQCTVSAQAHLQSARQLQRKARTAHGGRVSIWAGHAATHPVCRWRISGGIMTQPEPLVQHASTHHLYAGSLHVMSRMPFADGSNRHCTCIRQSSGRSADMTVPISWQHPLPALCSRLTRPIAAQDLACVVNCTCSSMRGAHMSPRLAHAPGRPAASRATAMRSIAAGRECARLL